MKIFFCSNWFALILIILFVGFDIAIHIPIVNIESNYFGAMVGFIGVIATFVVIGNYAQVKDMERRFDKSIEDIETKVNESLIAMRDIQDKTGEIAGLVGKASDYEPLIQKLKKEGYYPE